MGLGATRIFFHVEEHQPIQKHQQQQHQQTKQQSQQQVNDLSHNRKENTGC
jgi:hypothetical protein